jgi:hypothetical protein
MVSITVLAAIGGAAAATTALATGNTAVATGAMHAIPPGLKVALAHVPSWTKAHEIIGQKVAEYLQSSGVGATAAGLAEAVKHGISLGLRR